MKQEVFFPEIKGRLAFGCMRLPMNGDDVNYDEFCKMADAFIDAGFNYFDTAHGYIGGKSETAIRDCVSARHSRDEFLLTNKLSGGHFKKQEDIRPLFENQLKLCGVDYFDFYLMHAQDSGNYPQYQKCKAYETAYKFKEEGLIRHFGISFHDKAEMLEKILTEHPEIEVVQIQLNYIDYQDSSVDSKRVYEICEKYNKPVLIMEPVKGGSLVNLPDSANEIFKNLGGGSNASYAIRFAAGFRNVCCVLSGMSDLQQMEDNTSYMKDFAPLTDRERMAVAEVCGIFKGNNLIPCTSCRYCVLDNDCPKDILIPDAFAALNSHNAFKGWNAEYYYNHVLTNGHGKASDCIKCGKCEKICPQHLEIRKLLGDVVRAFEK